MRKSIEFDVIPSSLLGAGLFFIGLVSLNHIVNNWWPFDVGRLDLVRETALDQAEATIILDSANPEIMLAFLAAVLLTVTGLMLPLTSYLNKRFAPAKPPTYFTVVRQAMWVGLWVAFCVWLQMNRALGLAVVGLVAAVLVMFEALLHVRTRATNITGNS
jgi:hypothetical protein